MSASLPNPEHLNDVLAFVAKLGQVAATHTDMQPILEWIVPNTTQMLRADEGCIRLSDPDGAESDGGRTRFRRDKAGGAGASWPRAIGMSVEGYFVHKGEGILSADLLNDPRFPGLRGLDTQVRAILAVPLRVEDRISGVLAVTESKPGRMWTEGESQLLTIVASHCSAVIEQARLRLEAIERRRLQEELEARERELKTAKGIQMSFVPSRPLAVGGWEIRGHVEPASDVGGDAYDYFMGEGGRLCFAIGDVSGKGVPAALLMSNVQASLRAFCDGREAIPGAIRHINTSVARSANGKFVTLFYGELDPGGTRLRFVNAGHNYPLLRRADGSVEYLKEGGLPLGLFDGTDYVEGETAFGAGDALLLYSDGVTEARDAAGRDYGDDRLLALWGSLGTHAPAEAIERLMSDVVAFRGDAPQSDDITLVTLGRHPG